MTWKAQADLLMKQRSPLSSRRPSPIWVLLLIALGIIYLKSLAGSDSESTQSIEHAGADRVSGPKAWPGQASNNPHLHPIRALHEAATRRYDAMLDRQSRTLEEATEEYKRRYKRNPPPGFASWYHFAKKQNAAIVDDYDIIADSLEPFWDVSPARILESVKQAVADNPYLLYRWRIKDGKVSTHQEDWFGKIIGENLGNLTQEFPNVDILINLLDEPRVLATTGQEDLIWKETSQRPSWDLIAKPCRDRDRARQSTDIDTYGLPFVTDVPAARDVCSNPSLKDAHGFFLGPTTMLTTSAQLPVLSQARASTFSDILYPSVWYQRRKIADLDSYDPAWANKSNSLYWAGSTTGGWTTEKAASRPLRWRSHRLRFVDLTQQLSPQVHTFLTQGKNNPWVPYESNEILSSLYKTKFTRVVQCDKGACAAMKDYFQIGKMDDKTEPFKHRFVMDIDGNSFSGRFYNLLSSKSCVLKHTIFQEWHDERLVPWVHYVPVSTGLEELPELMRYLALTEEGNEIARRIANNGRTAVAKLLRQEDQVVYMYRLLLEYARVTSSERDQLD